MSMGVKRLVKILLLVAMPIAVTSCTKKATYPNCKNDNDCRVDAMGNEKNGICYMGQCEECAEDGDCTDLKQCVRNRCLSACQADADCGANKHCDNSFCVADCLDNEACPGNHICAEGRCVAEGYGSDPNAWAPSDCQGLERVHFDFDKYSVKPEYHASLEHIAQCLLKHSSHVITIVGYTDDVGTPSYNAVLGQKRANAVKEYLEASWGIASYRVKTISRGENDPLMEGPTEHARQQNRRTEFVLQK